MNSFEKVNMYEFPIWIIIDIDQIHLIEISSINPLCAGPTIMQVPKLIIIMPANVLALISARPSGGTEPPTKLYLWWCKTILNEM